MKKLLFALFFISLPFYAQQKEVAQDSLPELKKSLPKMNEKLENYLKLDENITFKQEKSILSPDYTYSEPLIKKEKKEIDLKIPPLDIYTGPPLESNTFTRYPFANDYTFNSGMKISDNMWISTSSSQNTYPTLGAVRKINMNLNYQPFERLIISGGTYGAKYTLGESTFNFYEGGHPSNFGINAYNDVGATGSIKFILHDRIRLNAYGQYSAFGEKNGLRGPMIDMFPQTFYGGTIEVKITEKFGVEGGVIRELNPFNGKWVNRPYFAPVFYMSK